MTTTMTMRMLMHPIVRTGCDSYGDARTWPDPC
jgi:hypothetical protein